MIWPFHPLYRKAVWTLRQQGWSAFLTLCAAAIQISAANALTGPASVSSIEAAGQSGPAVARPVAYCDREPCPEYEPAPRPYRAGPPIEVPCGETPLPRIYTYRPDPPRGYVETRDYEEVREESYCGIRCWYLKIRDGHCGRGCDYYMYRLRHFPSGRFGPDTSQRVACRDRW